MDAILSIERSQPPIITTYMAMPTNRFIVGLLYLGVERFEPRRQAARSTFPLRLASHCFGSRVAGPAQSVSGAHRRFLRCSGLRTAFPFRCSHAHGMSPFIEHRKLPLNPLKPANVPPVPWFERVVSLASQKFLLEQSASESRPFVDCS
jgi:hypothetical protein